MQHTSSRLPAPHCGQRCRVHTVRVTVIATQGQQQQRPKSPTGNWQRLIPLIGETPAYIKDHYTFVRERIEKHGSVFQSHIYGFPVVFLTSWKARDAVAEGIHKTTKTWHPPSFMELMGNDPQGAIAAGMQRESHQVMRRRVGAALSSDAITSYLPLVESLVRSHMADWQASGDFDLEAKLRGLTLSFSNEIVVGMGLTAEQKEQLAYHFNSYTKNLYCLMIDLPGTPYRLAKEAKRNLLDILRPNVQAAIADLEAGKWASVKRRSAVQNYLYLAQQEGQPLNASAVADFVLNLMVAGYDTSAWSYLALLVLLPQVPKRCIQRLREEQQQVVAQHGETLTAAALSASKYADAFAREALRLKGPVPISLKRSIAELEIDGHQIPADTVLAISTVFARAHDQKVLKGPPLVGGALPSHMDLEDLESSFQPERWLSPETTPTSDGQFGAGAHFCLGWPLYMAEAKALLAVYARKYDMTFVQDGPIRWQGGGVIATVEPVIARLASYAPQ